RRARRAESALPGADDDRAPVRRRRGPGPLPVDRGLGGPARPRRARRRRRHCLERAAVPPPLTSGRRRGPAALSEPSALSESETGITEIAPAEVLNWSRGVFARIST